MVFLKELPTSGVLDTDPLDSEGDNCSTKYRQRFNDALRNKFSSEYLDSCINMLSRKENLNSYKLMALFF